MTPVPHRAGNGRIFVEKYKSRWKPYCGAGNLYAKNAFWVFWETEGEAFQPMQNAAVDWKTGGERNREKTTVGLYYAYGYCVPRNAQLHPFNAFREADSNGQPEGPETIWSLWALYKRQKKGFGGLCYR